MVGAALANASAPLAVRSGRLHVAVLHAAAAQEIRLRAGAIVAAVNRELGDPVVREVATVPRRTLPGAVTRRAPRPAPRGARR
jgi:hypothetical protein